MASESAVCLANELFLDSWAVKEAQIHEKTLYQFFCIQKAQQVSIDRGRHGKRIAFMNGRYNCLYGILAVNDIIVN